jgi:hypothetical protein
VLHGFRNCSIQDRKSKASRCEGLHEWELKILEQDIM